MAKRKFTPTDLRRIRENTTYNNHSENYVFISNKIRSPLEKNFKEILKEQNRFGFLPEKLSQKRYVLYRKLVKELKHKYPAEYQEIYMRL